MVSSSDEDSLGHFFGAAGDVYKAPVSASDKIFEYKRPSNGQILQIRTVGHHVLWANYLWNGSHWMSDYVDEHAQEFMGKSILELGAGAGLPSILAAKAGAKPVVITDYPDVELIENIQKNIDSILVDDNKEHVYAKGYLWGADVQELLALNQGKLFDLIFMCDVIFNHSEHGALLKTIEKCLAPTGMVWCVFSHYRPWLKQRDLELLERAAEESGLFVEKIEEKKYDEPVIVENNNRTDPEVIKIVYAYRFYKQAVNK